ncbi:hypothetical protein D3C79_829370 [compost metagenome]
MQQIRPDSIYACRLPVCRQAGGLNAVRQNDGVPERALAEDYSRFYIWKLKRLDGYYMSC